MLLEKQPPEESILKGVNSPRVCEVVLGTVPDFIDFRKYSSFTFFYGDCVASLRELSGRGCQTLSFITVQ